MCRAVRVLLCCMPVPVDSTNTNNTDNDELEDDKGNAYTDVDQYGGHATAILWDDTTEVGCAIAQCDSGWTYLVCQYSPA